MARPLGDDRSGAARPSLREQILRRKPVAAMTAESGTDAGQGELARSIGLVQLTLFGVGATIGTTSRTSRPSA